VLFITLWIHSFDKLLYSVSRDGGQTWEEAVEIGTFGSMSMWDGKRIDSDNDGRLYLQPSQTTLWISSDDGGKTWPIKRSTPGGVVPDKEGNLYSAVTIGVIDQKVGFRKSTDQGETWSDVKEIASGRLMKMSVDSNGRILVVSGVYANYAYKLYFTKSEDQGESWTEPILLSSDTAVDSKCFIAADGSGKIAVVVAEIVINLEDDSEIVDLYTFISDDNGDHWSSRVYVTGQDVYPNYGYYKEAYPFAVIDPDGYLSILISGYNGTFVFKSKDIFIKKNNTSTWIVNTLAPDSGSGLPPSSIALDNQGNSMVVYGRVYSSLPLSEQGIFYTRSERGTDTWSQAIKISKDEIQYYPLYPDTILVDNQEVIHAFYISGDEGRSWIFETKSLDGGLTWSNGEKKVTYSEYNFDAITSVLGPDGTFYLVWTEPSREFMATNGGIYFSTSTDQGQTWSAPIKIAGPYEGDSLRYLVAKAGPSGEVYVAWSDIMWVEEHPGSYGGYTLFYFSRGVDQGSFWTDRKRLDQTNYPDLCEGIPAFNLDPAGNPYFAYTAYSNSQGKLGAYFTKSMDGGENWTTATEIPGFATTAAIFGISLSVDSQGNIYFSCSEIKEGLDEGVFFTKSEDGGSSWVDPVKLAEGYQPGLDILPSGELFFSYVNGPLYYRLSSDGGETWSDPSAVLGVYKVSFITPNSIYFTGDSTLVKGTFNNEGEVWSGEIPLDIVGIGGIAYAVFSIPGLNTSGKYTFEGILYSGLDQKIIEMGKEFYVSGEGYYLTLTKDKPVYKPGETVSISGEIISSISGNFDLNVKKDKEVILTENFSLQAGESRPFSVQTTSDHPFMIEATVNLFSAVEKVIVMAPSIKGEITAPDQVGRNQSYQVGFSIQNDGKVDLELLLRAVEAPEGAPEEEKFQEEVLLKAGQFWHKDITKIVGESPIPNTSWRLEISGDLSQMIVKPVNFGEKVTASINASANYLTQSVSIPVSLKTRGPWIQALKPFLPLIIRK
jgi:hypothetical protein